MIELLERLKIIPLDKAAILLVHGGLKPTAFIAIPSSVARDTEPVNPQLLQDLKTAIKGFNLSYKIHTVEIDGCTVYRFFIGTSEQSAEYLRTVFNTSPRDEVEVGRLLGYPKTATQAYIISKMLDISKVPKSTDMVSVEAMQFLNHRLSEEYWKEEVTYLETYSTYVAEASPEVWRQVVGK